MSQDEKAVTDGRWPDRPGAELDARFEDLLGECERLIERARPPLSPPAPREDRVRERITTWRREHRRERVEA